MSASDYQRQYEPILSGWPEGASGTTLIAAEKAGRVARLIELDPKYADVIVRRWEDFTGKRAILEATGEPFPEA